MYISLVERILKAEDISFFKKNIPPTFKRDLKLLLYMIVKLERERETRNYMPSVSGTGQQKD